MNFPNPEPTPAGPNFYGSNAPHVPMQPTSTTVLWSGVSEDLANVASGGRVATSSYKLTEDALQFEDGVLSKTAETLPLWAVLDVDLRQTLTQRARKVGDLILRVDPSGYKYGQSQVTLRSIQNVTDVRDLLVRQANAVRASMLKRQHEMEIERRRACASQMSVTAPVVPVAADATNTGDNLLDQLARLASLRDAGVLSADEFAAAKAKLLA